MTAAARHATIVNGRWEVVIGIECHVQLQTTTKIFSGSSAAFGAAPNSNTDPTVLGLPGALPVLNRRAVEFAVRLGLAAGCRIRPLSIFARKNYFYPDLPKGYQISQYEQPLASEGALEFTASGGARRIGITRVHMEEDAGKSLHEGFADSDRRTYLDYNRAGVPLIEIVTEPELRSPVEAATFFETLRQVLSLSEATTWLELVPRLPGWIQWRAVRVVQDHPRSGSERP